MSSRLPRSHNTHPSGWATRRAAPVKLWPPPPSREMERMYVCVRACVYVPALCARTHDRQRVPETRIHAMHAGKPRYPCAHPTVTRTSVHMCACIHGPALRAPAATLAALAASCMRACVQQDATGALGTCIRTRMRARQTHAEERGGKGGPRRRHTLDAPPVPENVPAGHGMQGRMVTVA